MTQELKTAIKLVVNYKEMPFLFSLSKKENPELLVKFISDQACGRLANQQLVMPTNINFYKATVKIFSKELVDACIKAYPNE
jgi:hypothetical protein